MKILAIETSCDETAISIIEANGSLGNADFKVLSNTIQTQIELHKEFGGVYPNLAKREHGRNLLPVLKKSLQEAGFEISKSQDAENKQIPNDQIKKLEKILEREPELLEQFLKEIPTIEKPNTRPVRDSEGSQRLNSNGIDALAVTYGPGLEPALWVGINFAKALSIVWDIPIIPTNHMEGHIFSAFMSGKENSKFQITNSKFPMLALLVSGGHTELILIKDWLQYKKIGQTRDDAAGEAFDKVARILGLPYPGGPEISAIAQKSRQIDGRATSVNLPRPMINTDDFDFSFSGLKTAVLYMVKKIPNITPQIKADIAKEFQQAVVDTLVSKTIKAAKMHDTKTIVIGGGVSANKELRTQLGNEIKKELPNSIFMIPDSKVTGDNASMIAVAAYFQYTKNGPVKDPLSIQAKGNLSL